MFGKLTKIILSMFLLLTSLSITRAVSVKAEDSVYTLQSSDLTAFASGAKGDGDEEKTGTDDFFTLVYSAKSKVDSSNKSFEDGYTSSQRINFGGKVSTTKNAIKFTVGNEATVTVWWVEGGDDNRQVAILDAEGNVVTQTSVTATKNEALISKLELSEAGTYYLGGLENNNYFFKVEVTEKEIVVPDQVYELISADMTAFASGEKADGDEEKFGLDDFFTVIYSAKSKVDSSNKSFEDGYSSNQRLNLGGKVSTSKNAVKFTTTGAATVQVWWVEGGDDNRAMGIIDGSGNVVVKTDVTVAKNEAVISTLELAEAGTYYLGGIENNNYIFKVVVTVKGSSAPKPERAAWDSVAAPVITNVSADGTTVTVDYDMLIGYDGADKVTVTLKDADGNETVKNKSQEGTSGSVEFSVSATGKYNFSIVAVRDGEENKEGNNVDYDYVLPLQVPSIASALSLGGGTVKVVINNVAEADGYIVEYMISGDVKQVSVECAKDQPTTEVELTGLTVGEDVSIKVASTRVGITGNSEYSDATIVKVTEGEQADWRFAAFGSSTNKTSNGYSGSINDGSVTVYSEGGKGKIVPGSTDGLAYYFTPVAADKYIKISGNIHVDSWTLSNGQEGFGLMVSDAVGVHGDSNSFWNNSVQAIATKIEYNYDGEAVTSDTSASKISMKLGVGIISKTGVTSEDVANITAGKATMPENFVTKTTTLETSAGKSGTGTYNVIGNSTNTPVSDGLTGITDLKFEMESIICDGEYGYKVTYLANDEVIGSETIMVGDNDMISIDKDHKYVGFFASRNARITVTDVTLEVKDEPTEIVIEDTKVTPNYTITSANNASNPAYKLTYKSDVKGNVVVKLEDGTVIAEQAFEPNTVYSFDVTLKLGDNKIIVVSTPEAGYRPSAHEVLDSYEPNTQSINVSYNEFSNDVIYVSPEATNSGLGTRENPVDIYTAVKFVKAGQKIVIMEGTYNLSSTVKVARGIDGTADKPIYFMADPEAFTRPVFDFGGKCEGMVFGGNYWYITGFDVTNSANGKDGARLCGNNNVIDNCEFYRNGNTGLQISAYLNSNDPREMWPSNNLVLNCSSYGNADAGYEDADGFAAKLTCGEGNVFDGCIAFNNADDGWDLFAKVQTGNIGAVTIRNCVAFGNGYLEDGTNAGNGNGFKMGGESLTGYHVLSNSVAFNNKAKGIDSNSCPDIQVEKSISFNNESYNVALYTNTAVNTDFAANGIISYRTLFTSVNENFKLKGTQDLTKVYNSTNYFWNCSEAGCNNANGTVTDDWFITVDTTWDETNHVFVKKSRVISDTLSPITRNDDNTVNMNGILVLKNPAADQCTLGQQGSGTASITEEQLAELIAGGTATDGLIYPGKEITPPAVDDDTVPATGDNNATVIASMVSVSSLIALGATIVLKKKYELD